MDRRRFSIAAALGATALSLFGFAASVAQPAQPALNAPQQRAMAAYEAMGFRDNYQGEGVRAPDMLWTLTTRATMQQWDPGQPVSVNNLLVPDWGTSTYVERWDRGRGFIRTDWVRPRAGGGNRTYTEIMLSNGGYVIGNDANGALTRRTVEGSNPPLHTMSGLRLRALLREHERNNIVLAMHDYIERVSAHPNVTVAGRDYPAVQYRGDNATFIVMFDPASGLPAIVRTRDFDQYMGDANFDAAYSDWRPIEGVRLPHRIAYTLNGEKVFDTTVNAYEMNPTLASDAFSIPVPLRGKAIASAPIEKTPFQWVLRRLASGFYLDSDALYTDDGAALRLADVTPNISHAVGGSHHSLIVDAGSYLVVFEAPGDDGQSQWVIDAAAQKYPGKPIRYVVITHHHIDHAGGLRAYAARGAAIVVGKPDGAFFRNVLSAPATLNPYPLAGPITPNVIEVDGKWSVSDGGRTVEAYLIETSHAEGYLIPYVPDAKLGFVTDLWGPGAPLPAMTNPNLTSVVRGMEKWGLTPERFAGGHGAVGNYADLATLVGPAR